MNTLISPIIFHCKPNFFNNIRKNTYNVPILKILIFICIIQICDSTQFDYNAFKNTINQKNSFLYPENEHQNSHNPHGLIKYLELDTSLPTVTCKQCIQLWRFHSKDQKGPLCGIHAPTCQGNACFMRQCKKCGAYQYMSGCLKLSKWQLMDLQLAKQKGELVANRAGATMLCQDNDNHTTCFCNKREKCNDIHMRNPFTTFQGSSFSTILQVDEAIAKIDPNYGLEINLYGGYQTRRHDLRMNSSGKHISFIINFALFILYIFYFF